MQAPDMGPEAPLHELPKWIGAAGAIANCRVSGELGVKSTLPAWVANPGVKVTVPATEPVWSPMCGPCAPKIAFSLLAEDRKRDRSAARRELHGRFGWQTARNV